MNHLLRFAPLFLLTTTIIATVGCGDPSRASHTGRTANGPSYASAETERIVQSMIEAHGGMERWAEAATISYDNIFFNPYAQPGEDPWWYATETIEQGTRRSIQQWRTDDALLVFDGERTWTTNWTKANPPTFMVHFFYYFVNLPWLTQDPGVSLSEPEMVAVPGFDVELHAIDMTFDEHPSSVKSGLDSYRLYIHPETNLLSAYEYRVGFAAMLDLMGVPEGEVFGPVLRIHDEFVEEGGLIFPERMHTMSPDGSEIWGHHLLTRYSVEQPFNESLMQMPPDARIDDARRDR